MKTPGHAATALQALEELRLEEDAAHQAAIRAGQVVALKDALHKLRSITYDCKIDWEGILIAQQTEDQEDERNLTDEQFVEALHAVNEKTADKLTPGEFETLLRKFCDYKGDVRITHFMNAMNLGAPKDHADPELFFDELPQPYRNIVDVMEEFILDAAWDIIDQKYKLSGAVGGTEEDETTGEENKRIAKAMATKCFSINNVKIPGTNPSVMSLSEDGTRVVVGCDDGSLHLVSTEEYDVLSTVSVFPESHGGVLCISPLVHSESFPVTGEQPYVFAVGATQLTKQQFAAAEAAKQAALASAAEPEPPEKGKKAPKKGKGKEPAASEVEMPEKPGGFLRVYEVWPGQPNFVLVGSAEVDSEVAATIVARGAEYVSVSSVDGAVRVYAIPSRPIPPAPAKLGAFGDVHQMAPVAEEMELAEKANEDGEEAPSRYSRENCVLERLALSITLLPEDRKGVLKPTKSELAVPEPVVPDDGEIISSAGDAATAPVPELVLTGNVHFIRTVSNSKGTAVTTGLFVWWPGGNHLRRYFLHDAAVHTSHVLHSEWFMASAITASEMDNACSILAVGLADGSVVVWDINTGTTRALFRRHTGLVGNRAAVSSVCIYGQRYVVSGAMDGSLQINDLRNGSITTRFLALMAGVARRREQSDNLVKLNSESKMVAMREKDGSTAVLSLSCLSDLPIALAVCEDGQGMVVCRVYDLPSGSFMGCLDLRNSKEEDTESCQWMIGQCGSDPAVDSGLDDRLEGDACRSGRLAASRLSGRGVVAAGGKKSLGPTKVMAQASNSGIFVMCANKVQAKEAYNFVPKAAPPAAESGGEEAVTEPEPAPKVEYQIAAYANWKLICDAYPAIAACCTDEPEIVQNAKRLFMITTAEQRSDPNADLNAFLMGPPGLHPKPYGNAVPRAPSATRKGAPSVSSHRSSKVSHGNNLSRGNSRTFPPQSIESGAGIGSAAGSRLVSDSGAHSTHTGTAGRRGSGVSAASNRSNHNALVSLALGNIPLEEGAETLHLEGPVRNDGSVLLKKFLDMKNRTKNKRVLQVKKRGEEMLKWCTPEL